MARIKTNPFTRGFSGKFGDAMVFRTMRGRTFVSPPARVSNKNKQSEAQRNTRVTFREASQWAQQILLDENKKAYYQERAKALKLPNAYTAALTDYMRKSKVETFTQRHRVYVSVRKKGFRIPKVAVTTMEDAQPNAKVYARALGWQIEVPTAPAGNVYSLNIIITDYFGRVMVERVDVAATGARSSAVTNAIAAE